MQLYDYQLDAIDRMKNGCILCGGVGSGKSLTALGYFYLQCGGDKEFLKGSEYTLMRYPKNLYIITTARKRDTMEWEMELTKFYFTTSDSDETRLYKDMIVKVDSWNNIKKYIDTYNAFFIFDEQRVVGSGSWVKSFLKIVKRNDWILLSATPGDTWQDYIPVFIANGFYKNRSEFIREHIVYSRFSKYPKVEKYLNTGRLVRLRRSILVTMDFQRQVKQHHIDISVEYDKLQYHEIGKTRWNPYKDEPIANASELCYVWRKIVNSDVTRLQALADIWDEHRRLIVFYNFDYELELIKMWFVYIDEVAEWNGHKHQPIPESDEWMYLVQYNAGAEGWNCILTDAIVFYSQNYSYKIMEQSAGRIDRLNTPFTDLYFYHLKSKAPIDLAIARAIKNKKTFSESGFAKFTPSIMEQKHN